MIRDASGQSHSLIRRSWEAAMAVKGIDKVYIATDDMRIASHVEDFGGNPIMTSAECANGTERCGEAMKKIGSEAEIIINFQGDALLTPPWIVEELIGALEQQPDVSIATPVVRADLETWHTLQQEKQAHRLGATTAVFTKDKKALYFSREVLPYINDEAAEQAKSLPVYVHVGVYAYRPDALDTYNSWSMGPLEEKEGLEQLRFLENGQQVLCVEISTRGRVLWDLNNPEDIERIERALNDV